MLLLLVCGTAFAVAYALVVRYLVRTYGIKRSEWVLASVVMASLAGIGITIFVSTDRAEGLEQDARDLTAPWSQPAGARRVASASTADRTGQPPVASLIDGLEARLRDDPTDVKGWALLAQSRAFVGNEAGAEEAIANATRLGMDEAALRERVRAARRTATQ